MNQGRQSSARTCVSFCKRKALLLDLGEPLRAGLDALGIPFARALAASASSARAALDDPGVGRERPVDRGGLVDLGSEPGQLVADRRVAFVEAFGRAARGALEKLGVAQARAFALEVHVLAGARVELVDLPELPAEKVLPLGPAALLGGRGLELTHDGGERVDLFGDARAVGVKVPERVEVVGVSRRVGQGHALVLRGDVAQVARDLGELRRGT